MARCEDCLHYEVCEALEQGNGLMKVSPIHCGFYKPSADVVPKSEVDRLETEVRLLTENSISAKYPCCVSTSKGLILTKSLEEYDKLLADIASEVASEIFEEIDKILNESRQGEYSKEFGFLNRVSYNGYVLGKGLAELKKKYTE